MILVVGSIQPRSYTAKDGSSRSQTEIVVDEVYFCGDKAPSGPVNVEVDDDEPLPF